MTRVAILVVGLATAVAGAALGFVAGSTFDSKDETVISVTTTTVTEPGASAEGLPAPVEASRVALLEAAETGDYEALRPLIPSTFRYTFGEQVEGGSIAFWQELERTTDQRPLETLAAILRMPYVLSRGMYYWPWAYQVESVRDLSEHERDLLAPLGPLQTLYAPGTGYLGWRTGIAPDGTWTFFVAGD